MSSNEVAAVESSSSNSDAQDGTSVHQSLRSVMYSQDCKEQNQSGDQSGPSDTHDSIASGSGHGVELPSMSLEEEALQREALVNEIRLVERKLEELQSQNPQVSTAGNDANGHNLNQEPESVHELAIREQQLMDQVQAAQAEYDKVMADLSKAREEDEALRRNEAIYWREYREAEVTLLKQRDDLEALVQKQKYNVEFLEQLRHTNVVNDLFYITTAGSIASINGFRLGSLAPEEQVPVEEINAGLGQVARLLSVIMNQLGMSSTKYELGLRGPYSTIVEKPDTVFPLFSTGNSLFTSMLGTNKFDKGLACLLGLLAEIQFEVSKRRKGFRPPYSIEGDCIQSLSVKRRFKDSKDWTRALRFMLTNAKHLLAEIIKLQGLKQLTEREQSAQ